MLDAPTAPTTARRAKQARQTSEEYAALGRAARATVPRSLHGAWQPAADRPDPVAVLEEQAASRVPELVPIRYGRMLVSPFTFFRGGAALMAADLAPGPRTGLETQLCGDAHLSNFGGFAAPDRQLVFGVNDFDETLPGPFEWDVKRLVASFEVAARDRGFNAKERSMIVARVSRAYRDAMRGYAASTSLDTWYARHEVDDLVDMVLQKARPKQIRRFERNLAKTRSKDSMRAFDKLATIIDGELRIAGDHPLITPIEDVADRPDERARIDELIDNVLRAYRRTLPHDRRVLLERYHYVHAARKVVGVGSVGTRAWIMLLLGRDARDPLFLQFKEAEASVLEPYLGASRYANHGQRVVEGQRLMQAASDIMLGWIRLDLRGEQRDFYVRQLWDQKGSALVELMDPLLMTGYAELCGQTLARAHARSGEPIAIASYLGTGSAFDRAMVEFASSYADQNERDYALLQAAAGDGRIEVVTGL
ncbi:MAG TPA: DUF2252 domain-containing protein [Solirubrobacteraceae bacterium]|nr:DUF2252 domain-containing protein [Solirubrobacteraceae bacterium]